MIYIIIQSEKKKSSSNQVSKRDFELHQIKKGEYKDFNSEMEKAMKMVRGPSDIQLEDSTLNVQKIKRQSLKEVTTNDSAKKSVITVQKSRKQSNRKVATNDLVTSINKNKLTSNTKKNVLTVFLNSIGIGLTDIVLTDKYSLEAAQALELQVISNIIPLIILIVFIIVYIRI